MTCAGTQVDDPVGVRHDGLMMFDDDDGLAAIDHPVQQRQQLFDICQVQAGRRLVQDVDVALLPHLRGELESLPLAAGQRGQWLPEGEVAKPDVDHPGKDFLGGRHVCVTAREELLRIGDGHGQHFGDVLPTEGVFEHRGAEPPAFALFTAGFDGRHHPQIGVDDAGAVARRAGAFRIRAEQCGFDVIGLRERLADVVEQSGVGGRVAPSRSPDRRLIDGDDALAPGHRTVDQGALARACHARDHGEHAERDVHVDVLQIVGIGTANLQRAVGLSHRILQRRPVVEVPAGDAAAAAQPLHRAFVHHLATASARLGAEVDDVVGDRDHFRLVFDDQHGVSLVPQLDQQFVHAGDVVRMQADGRLVEHVGDVGQRRAEMTNHLDPLRLSAGQGPGGPRQRQIAQPDSDERIEGVPQRRQQRRHAGAEALVVGQHADPIGQVGDLHGASLSDVDALDL